MLQSRRDPVLKTPGEMDAMRRAGDLVARLHAMAREACRPGVTTGDLDRLIDRAIAEAGAEGLFKGYRQGESPAFPGSACISVNDEVVHGVPGPRVIRAGDLVSIDIGLRLDGWCADRATSVLVAPGDGASPEQRGRHDRLDRLVRDTRQVLADAIERIRPGRWWTEIAREMERAGVDRGYGIVTQYVGHGIGRSLHEPPKVPAFVTSYKGRDFRLVPGLVLAIEPMLTVGGSAADRRGVPDPWRTRVRLAEDGWTVRTADASVSCHEEMVIGVTDEGARLLTPASGGPEREGSPG